MNDRGMKKWAPYKSLNEQETFLNQMREKRSRIEKPIISQDLAEQINYLLLNHNNKELLFTFYKNGHIYQIKQKILNIDLTTRIIKGSEINLSIDDITNLEEE